MEAKCTKESGGAKSFFSCGTRGGKHRLIVKALDEGVILDQIMIYIK